MIFCRFSHFLRANQWAQWSEAGFSGWFECTKNWKGQFRTPFMYQFRMLIHPANGRASDHSSHKLLFIILTELNACCRIIWNGFLMFDLRSSEFVWLMFADKEIFENYSPPPTIPELLNSFRFVFSIEFFSPIPSESIDFSSCETTGMKKSRKQNENLISFQHSWLELSKCI